MLTVKPGENNIGTAISVEIPIVARETNDFVSGETVRD
jgi:hypothetical protein